jgi:serine/threonine-protein kinase
LRIRRRFASGGAITRLLDSIKNRFLPRPDDDRAGPVVPDQETGGMGGTSGMGGMEAGRKPGWVGRMVDRAAALPVPAPFRDRRFTGLAWGVFLGTLLVGYLLAALVFFPAPIFASNRSVPRVLGLQEAAARERLGAARLRVGAVARESHPTAAAGTVVWQEPPPGVVAPEQTDVTLTVSEGPRRIPVPDVAGYEAEHARLLLEAAGLRVGSTESTQAPTPRNVVVNTRPPAGAALSPGGSVTLVVSVGTATLRVPSLKGLSLDEARLALETAGLALGTWFSQTPSDPDVAPGEIFYQEPAAGTLSAPGTAVHVRIARSGQ